MFFKYQLGMVHQIYKTAEISGLEPARVQQTRNTSLPSSQPVLFSLMTDQGLGPTAIHSKAQSTPHLMLDKPFPPLARKKKKHVAQHD